MPARLFVTCLLLLCAVGCGKHDVSPPPSQAADANITRPSEAAIPETTKTVTSTQADADQAQIAAVLAELTQVVRKYSVEQRRVPKSFDEMVSAGYLARPPQPPAGKHFAINKNLQVYLADR